MNCCGGIYNMSICQGTTYIKTFTWFAGMCCGKGTAGAQPAPVDLTGYTASMQIRPYPGSSVLYYDASEDFTLGGALGTILLVIPAADTDTFTWWSGVYDLILTDPYGIMTKLLSGTVTICPVVTIPSTGFTADSDITADSSMTADS